MTDMRIGALAERARVGVETVRYYQRIGLMPTPDKPLGLILSGGPVANRWSEAWSVSRVGAYSTDGGQRRSAPNMDLLRERKTQPTPVPCVAKDSCGPGAIGDIGLGVPLAQLPQPVSAPVLHKPSAHHHHPPAPASPIGGW